MKNINQEEFIELSQKSDSIILDVRHPDECASGIVPGARTINYMDNEYFTSEINKLDKEKNYLVYCRSGNRSMRACNMMQSIGIDQTYNLVGGMLAWTGETV